MERKWIQFSFSWKKYLESPLFRLEKVKGHQQCSSNRKYCAQELVESGRNHLKGLERWSFPCSRPPPTVCWCPPPSKAGLMKVFKSNLEHVKSSPWGVNGLLVFSWRNKDWCIEDTAGNESKVFMINLHSDPASTTKGSRWNTFLQVLTRHNVGFDFRF